MAITFRGTVKTPIIFGNDALTQNLFTIENLSPSRVNINIIRLVLQMDALAVYTAVMPLVKTSRATGISGGIVLEKGKFDTSLSSDSNCVFRAANAESAPIAATPGTVVWERFPGRMHTAVEQQQAIDFFYLTMLPSLVSNRPFIIRPGESLLVQVVAAAIAANPQASNNWFVECVYEEDAISTFTISGTVTLNSVAQAGAKVMVIEADDVDLTNAFLREVITTPAGGAWSSTIRTGKVGAAFVQYRDGTTYYTAPGSPFLS